MQRYILQVITTAGGGARALWILWETIENVFWNCPERLGGVHIYPPAPSAIDPGKSQGSLTPLLFQTAHESHITALEKPWKERERRGEAEEGDVVLHLREAYCCSNGKNKRVAESLCPIHWTFWLSSLYFFYIKNLNAYYLKTPKDIKEH